MINNPIKRLAKDFSIYGLGEILNRLTQILILPLIFSYLTTEEFGILDFFLTTKNLVVIVLGWGLLTSITRFGAKFSSYNFKEVTFNSLLIMLFLNATIFLVFLGSFFLFNDLVIIKDLKTGYLLTAIISILVALQTIPLGILRVKQEPQKYLIVSFISFLFFLIFTFILLEYFKLGYKSFLWSHVFSLFLSVFIGFRFTYKDFKVSINLKLMKSLLNFGLSILASSIAVVFIISSNRYFLKFTSEGFEDLGILGMATRFSVMVGALLVAPFNLAWLPFVNNIYKTEKFYEVIQNVYKWFTFFALFLIMGLSFIAPQIFKLINVQGYFESSYYIPFFATSYLFLGYYYIFAAGIYLSGSGKVFYKISFLIILINILLYLVFYKFLNLFVVSGITLITHILLSILAYNWGNDTLKIKVLSSKIPILILSSSAVIFLMSLNLFLYDNVWVNLVNNVLLLMLFPVLLFLMKFFEKPHYLFIKKAIFRKV